MDDLASRYDGARQSFTKMIAVGGVAAKIAPPGIWSIKCAKGLRDGLIRFATGVESSSLVQAIANGLLPREGDQPGDDTTPAESPLSVSKPTPERHPWRLHERLQMAEPGPTASAPNRPTGDVQ